MMTLKGGANLVERPPAFSADGKLLLVCTACTISVYSVNTGLLVNQLQGHTARVTSVSIGHYAGAAKSVISHAWTSSLDGTIRFWDFATGTLIKTISVGRPINSMVIPSLSKPAVGSAPMLRQVTAFLLVQWDKDLQNTDVDGKLKKQNGELDGKKKKKNHSRKLQHNHVDEPIFRVVLHNLTSGKPLPGHLAKVRTPQALVSSPLGGLVGMVDNRKTWVWKVPSIVFENANSLEVTLLHHTKALQALAFDPTETVVAASDDSGRILIWKNVGEHSFTFVAQGNEQEVAHKQKNHEESDMSGGVRGHDDAAALTTYHWHADEVNFLTFSADGTYLFSGGKEGVFVIWQLETSKRRFLPRLGSSLLFIASAPDASVFSISCADNTIKFVNIGTMTVEKSIQGIKPPVSLPEQAKNLELTRVAIQPQSGSLVLPAENMSLQFYDVFYDRHIAEVAISPRNFVPSSDKRKGGLDKTDGNGPVVFVTHVVFSTDGSVMATAEARLPEEGIGGGSCLKFWKQNSEKMEFILNTRVDEPHSAEVSSFVYHPSMNMAVSCSKAGDFKVWVQSESQRTNQDTLHVPSWRCRSVGSYQQKPMSCAAFSPDGTLLAVAAEELVTLWNPNSNGLLCVLANNPLHPIKLLSFVPKTHHLVTTSLGDQPQLTVWSLETLSICWSYGVTVEAIAVDARSTYFAILAPLNQKMVGGNGNKKNGQAVIAIFNVDDPFPTVIWNAQDIKGSALYFLPPNTISSELSEGVDGQSSKDSKLIFLSQHREYVVFNPFIPENESDANSNMRLNALDKQGPSAFEAVYGKAAVPEVEVSRETSRVKGVQPWGDLLNCPSHLIPLTKIGFTYLESLLEKQTSEL